MNIDTKILDKILAHWTKPHLKRLYMVTKWDLSRGHKIGSKHKTITIIHQMKRMKEIISIDAEKHLTKPNSLLWWSSVQFSHSVMSDSLWPLDCSTPGLLVHHQLLELAQTQVHWVRDAIQPSHPLSSPSPPAFNLSQHQGLFQWVSSSHQVAKMLELQLQYQYIPMNIQDWLPLGLTGLISQ